ncbi:MAG: phospholipase D family protein [Gemmatimonadetes bacterium]|nr:phospholipase D family protein [Gemmatimonadota bacterium]
MLGTRERTLLLESLRPPTGYRLRRAVGTSFTLDLMALLTAPLAFTFFDAHDDDGAPVADPVALLEALRRHAEKITLFRQAGAIGVPKPQQRLMAYLEGSVFEVQARREGGVFHPKIWVLNFEADDRPAIYRVLCLSRNLTFARTWDTCLRLEGQLTQRQRGYGRNKPFADLLLALPGLATRSIAPELQDDISRMADEVRRVDFRLPEPFTDFRVHNFGLARRRAWPFPKAGRSLAVSPFLVGSTVEELVRDHGLEVLISRPEALEDVVRSVGREGLPGTCYVLSPGASLDSRDAEGEVGEQADGSPPVDGSSPDIGSSADKDEVELVGLHAKLFLFEDGQKARLFTGSANATSAAFRQNVEVLVELYGRKRHCGINALLGVEDDQRHETLRSLLHEWRVPESFSPVDETQRGLERRADRLARVLGAVRLLATVRETEEEQRWDMLLSGELPEIPAEAEVRVWPATLPAGEARRIGGPREAGSRSVGSADRADAIATFNRLSFEALTAFFAFEVALREGQHEVRKRFAVTADLVGAPEDREQRILRSLLRDRRGVLQLLLLILMGEGADVSAFVEAARRSDKDAPGTFAGLDQGTLLEALLRSLSHNPRQIDDAARLIADLEKTPEGRDLLPEGLDEIWEPVWAARKALKS